MKTFKVKNYKGNLVESLSKFQKKYKGMKIVEACEDGNDLKIKAEESEKQPVEEAASGFKLTEAFEMMRKSGKNLAGIMVEISENLGNVATVAEAIDELGNETDKKTAKSFLNTVFPAALNFEYSQDSSKQWSDENAQRLEAIFAVASSLLQ